MTDYVKSTNFASKDALATGNPLKIVKGTEIDTEFNNIATAVATKADLNSPTFIGTPSAPTAAGGTNTTQVATTAFVTTAVSTSVTNERTAVATLTNKTLTSPTITGGSISGITDLAIADGGTGASTAEAAFTNIKQPATEVATGVVELATTAEAEAGTDTTRAVTAAGVEAHTIANDLGWGQTWQDVTSSRAVGTWYQNTTGRPIFVFVQLSTGGVDMWVNTTPSLTGAVMVANGDGDSGEWKTFFTIVPNNIYYYAQGGSVRIWSELR